ncbi:MAG: hypothetical protein ACNA8W_11475, partial [Bradymonadaceae bacterium]
IQGVEVVTNAVNTNAVCASNIAMACNGCTGLRLKSFRAQAGVASNGRRGTNGDDGVVGGDGTSVVTLDVNNSVAPGGSSPVGNRGGESGLRGGSGVGEDGMGPRGGLGGTGNPYNSVGLSGNDGGGGLATTQNTPLTTFGTLPSNLTFGCVRNHDGASGPENHGSGGGGSYFYFNGIAHSFSGGGGGSGGQFGQGGEFGAPSIGFLLANTAGGIVMDDVHFAGGQGGDGGSGGDGGAGGGGGWASTVFPTPDGNIAAGLGGYGAGGSGGHGGNGGPSIALFRHNATIGTINNPTYVTGIGGAPGAGGERGTAGGTGHIAGQDGHPGEGGRAGLTCAVFEQTPAEGGTNWPATIRESGCFNP